MIEIEENITSVLEPMGHEFTFAFNDFNQILTASGATYRYDQFGNLEQFVNALGNSSKLTNDSKGRIVVATDALGFSTAYTYGIGDNANLYSLCRWLFATC